MRVSEGLLQQRAPSCLLVAFLSLVKRAGEEWGSGRGGTCVDHWLQENVQGAFGGWGKEERGGGREEVVDSAVKTGSGEARASWVVEDAGRWGPVRRNDSTAKDTVAAGADVAEEKEGALRVARGCGRGTREKRVLLRTAASVCVWGALGARSIAARWALLKVLGYLLRGMRR